MTTTMGAPNPNNNMEGPLENQVQLPIEGGWISCKRLE